MEINAINNSFDYFSKMAEDGDSSLKIPGRDNEFNSIAIGDKNHQNTKTEDEKKSNFGVIKELTPDQKKAVEELQKLDRAVRAHESAHMAAGAGLVRGGATFKYTTGPDGKQYATGGEVKIDISEVPDNPQSTVMKMQQVQRAALAPVDPSHQDRVAASTASSIEAKARSEMYQNDSKGLNSDTSSKSRIDAAYGVNQNNTMLPGIIINYLHASK